MFNVTDNSKLFLSGMEKLKINAQNTIPLMRRIAEDMKTKVDFRFKQSKDPNGNSWEPLSEATISQRRKNSSKPLIDSGELRASINAKVTPTMAIVGSNKEYAAYQNFEAKKGEFGTVNVTENVREFTRTRRGRRENVRAFRRTRRMDIPWGYKSARQFIGFSDNQRRIYASWVRKYLLKGK